MKRRDFFKRFSSGLAAAGLVAQLQGWGWVAKLAEPKLTPVAEYVGGDAIGEVYLAYLETRPTTGRLVGVS